MCTEGLKRQVRKHHYRYKNLKLQAPLHQYKPVFHYAASSAFSLRDYNTRWACSSPMHSFPGRSKVSRTLPAAPPNAIIHFQELFLHLRGGFGPKGLGRSFYQLLLTRYATTGIRRRIARSKVPEWNALAAEGIASACSYLMYVHERAPTDVVGIYNAISLEVHYLLLTIVKIVNYMFTGVVSFIFPSWRSLIQRSF